MCYGDSGLDGGSAVEVTEERRARRLGRTTLSETHGGYAITTPSPNMQRSYRSNANTCARNAVISTMYKIVHIRISAVTIGSPIRKGFGLALVYIRHLIGSSFRIFIRIFRIELAELAEGFRYPPRGPDICVLSDEQT